MDGLELRPLLVSDIFDRCFTLIGRSWKQVLILGAAILLPVSILAWIVIRHVFSIFAVQDSAVWENGIPEPEMVASIFKAMGGFGIIAFVLFCAEVVLMVCYALLFCGKTVGKDYETSEIFELAFSARGFRAIVQRFLGEIGSIMAFIVPYFAIIFAVASGAGWFPILMSTLFLMAGMGFFLYLRVRWAFGLTTIAWEDQSIGGAFSRSSRLFSIRENATFWTVALFSVVTAFAVSLAATPLQYFAMYDVSTAYAAAFADNPFDPEFGSIAAAFADVGIMLAVLITFYITMQSAVKSAYLTTIYFDLRARHGEFATAEFDPSESDTSELGPSELGAGGDRDPHE